jgi:hypothetical protein
MVFDVFELWDDLIDKDKPVDQKDINDAFYTVFVKLPRDQFYNQHFSLFNPIIETTILDWFSANELEATLKIDALRQSYVLRCSAQQLIVMAARIVGGVEWATAVNTELRMMGDTWNEYAEKHGVK